VEEPRMVAADVPDRGRMFYLVDRQLDFIPEVKQFLDWKAATGHAPATIKAYCARLLWFYRFLATRQLSVTQVTTADVTEFVLWLRHPCRAGHDMQDARPHPLQVSTINLITQAVGTLYAFLLRRRLISQSPVVSETIAASAQAAERDLLAHTRRHRLTQRREVRIKEPVRLPATISEEAFHTFVQSIGCAGEPQADPSGFRDRLLCLLLKEGGFRLGELLGMHVEDLDFGQQAILVRFRPENENAARAKAGYGRDRLVHLPATLMGLLDVYLTEVWVEATPRTSHLWIVLKPEARNMAAEPTCGTALSLGATENMFQHYSKKSGIRLHPHQLRHTHATDLVRSYLRAGQPVDWKFIQERLGHASVVTTMQTYTHLEAFDHRQAYDAFVAKREVSHAH
jgi:integrase/recombinase XerD